MTPKDNREIAEWCGWRDIRPNMAGFLGCDPDGWRRQLPKYDNPNDCAEFEAVVLDQHLESSYAPALLKLCSNASPVWVLGYVASTFEIATATPEQRCEAILKVIREAKA